MLGRAVIALTRVPPAWPAIPLPADMSMEQVACVVLRGVTAHMLLTRTYPADHETTVLVHAAAGGLGTVLVRWAKSLGCTVIGTLGSAQKAGGDKAARAQEDLESGRTTGAIVLMI